MFAGKIARHLCTSGGRGENVICRRPAGAGREIPCNGTGRYKMRTVKCSDLAYLRYCYDLYALDAWAPLPRSCGIAARFLRWAGRRGRCSLAVTERHLHCREEADPAPPRSNAASPPYPTKKRHSALSLEKRSIAVPASCKNGDISMFFGGAYGIRTRDLHTASVKKHVLCRFVLFRVIAKIIYI